MSATARRLVRDQRTPLVAGLVLAATASWLYLIRMAGEMPAMSAEPMFRAAPTLVMWAVMMVGIMVPTAMPGILAFAKAEMHTRPADRPTRSWALAAGYVLAWTGFAFAATGTQWLLHEAAVLSAAKALDSPVLAGGVLVTAGLFQFTPLKHACLRYCRSPIGLLLQGVPEKNGAVLTTGIRFGLYCVGCCWALMALMFVGGVMSLSWMALLTMFILLEKVVGRWRLFSSALGLTLAAFGLFVMSGLPIPFQG